MLRFESPFVFFLSISSIFHEELHPKVNKNWKVLLHCTLAFKNKTPDCAQIQGDVAAAAGELQEKRLQLKLATPFLFAILNAICNLLLCVLFLKISTRTFFVKRIKAPCMKISLTQFSSACVFHVCMGKAWKGKRTPEFPFSLLGMNELDH